MNNRVLKVHPADDMIVALTDLKQGETIDFEGEKYVLNQNIQVKHKFSTKDFAVGEVLTMYGVPVGKASIPIKRGDLIHTQNLKHYSAEYVGKQKNIAWTAPDVSKWKNKTFNGFVRADGKVGTANYWLVVPTVFCENRNIEYIKDALVDNLGYGKPQKYRLFAEELVNKYKVSGSTQEIAAYDVPLTAIANKREKIFPNVDGIKFLMHHGGCGGTQQDAQALANLLAGYIMHPNVAGATVLSLGCQHLQVRRLEDAMKELGYNGSKPMYVFEQQQSESEEELIKNAIKKTMVGLHEANKARRTPVSLDKLVIGLECGGSDGFSGITANPAIGHTSDLVVALGGTAMLSEFPELCGVEQDIVDRAVDNTTADKFIDIMRKYEARAKEAGSGFDMNPSPGNIRDGLITDAIKSAGAAKKGGTSPVAEVLDYTEPTHKKGLSLLCTPGNDVESTTALAASGCNVILFTTGLGTPTGNPIVPVIKVSSNTMLMERMPDIIDIDAGTIVSGNDTIHSKGEEILDLVVKVAGGEVRTKAVQLGQDDFIPWKRGVSL